MRLISTILLCVLIIGGTFAYTSIDKSFKRQAAEKLYEKASGITRVSIERSFDCFGDPDFKEPAIRVLFQGKEAFVDQSKRLAPTTPIDFQLRGVEVLENTISVSAIVTSPDSFEPAAAGLRAMLVKIYHDEKLIAEKMLHATGSDISIDGEVKFEIPHTDQEHDHDHGHAH